MKIRIRFAKYGKMIYIGHLDIMRYFQKALRRAEIDLVYTQGYSPHPVLSFAAPLGVGITSCGEYADFEVNSTDSSSTMLERLNAVMVEGVRILDYKLLPDETKSAMSSVAAADYCLTFSDGHAPFDTYSYLNGFKEFLRRDSIIIEKETKKGSRTVDIRPLIYDYHLEMQSKTHDGPAIFLEVSTGSVDNLKPELVIKAYDPQACLCVCRLETYTRAENGSLIALGDMGSIIPDETELKCGKNA